MRHTSSSAFHLNSISLRSIHIHQEMCCLTNWDADYLLSGIAHIAIYCNKILIFSSSKIDFPVYFCRKHTSTLLSSFWNGIFVYTKALPSSSQNSEFIEVALLHCLGTPVAFFSLVLHSCFSLFTFCSFLFNLNFANFSLVQCHQKKTPCHLTTKKLF